MEVHGTVIEDAAWLRKTSDFAHINVAELEAVLKGLNLALKWGMTTIEVLDGLSDRAQLAARSVIGGLSRQDARSS